MGFSDDEPSELMAFQRKALALKNSLEVIDGTASIRNCSDESPIFVAGLGWRTGSTLVQRMLMTDSKTLIWGEPIDARALVAKFVDALTYPDELPDMWSHSRGVPAEPHKSWVTLLWPDPAFMRAGFQSLFRNWFGASAQHLGYSRWGLKEVRWSGLDAILLKWLFPGSHVLLVVRDPREAFRSLQAYPAYQRGGFVPAWDCNPIQDAESYSRYWNALANSWHAAREHIKIHEVRYDDIRAGTTDFDSVAHDFGLTTQSERALSKIINASPTTYHDDQTEGSLVVETRTAQGRSLFGFH